MSTEPDLKALALAATAGPWFHRQAGEGKRGDPYDWIADDPRPGKHRKIIIGRAALYGGTADYAYIAAANPQAVLALIAERDEARERHAQHLRHVQEWLCSMYAIMIDPCALDSEAPIEVLEACKQLEAAALEQREQLATCLAADAERDALRKAVGIGATYLDALGDNLLRNDADMLLDECDDPKSVAEHLRAALTPENG